MGRGARNHCDDQRRVGKPRQFGLSTRIGEPRIIGLGDLVTGSIKRVFDQVGVKPGEIPVVGWGNSLDTTQEVLHGYVNAAQWQDPQATSYVALSLAAMAASGIPPGFNVITGKLYEKDAAALYDKILSGK